MIFMLIYWQLEKQMKHGKKITNFKYDFFFGETMDRHI